MCKLLLCACLGKRVVFWQHCEKRLSFDVALCVTVGKCRFEYSGWVTEQIPCVCGQTPAWTEPSRCSVLTRGITQHLVFAVQWALREVLVSPSEAGGKVPALGNYSPCTVSKRQTPSENQGKASALSLHQRESSRRPISSFRHFKVKDYKRLGESHRPLCFKQFSCKLKCTVL